LDDDYQVLIKQKEKRVHCFHICTKQVEGKKNSSFPCLKNTGENNLSQCNVFICQKTKEEPIDLSITSIWPWYWKDGESQRGEENAALQSLGVPSLITIWWPCPAR